MPNTATIKVYVRKDGYGNTPNRIMSFDRPADITASDALDHGYAIDGMSLVISAKTSDLHLKQEALIAWLSELNYEVEFA